MAWDVVFIVAEVLAAASLAAVRPFLALVLVLGVARLHQAQLPGGMAWLTGAPLLAVLTALAGFEHWRKWRERSELLDVSHLRDLPHQAKAAIVGVMIFEALRVAGPDRGVEMAQVVIHRLGETLPDMVVRGVLALAVAGLSAGFAKLHRKLERGVTQTLGGSRWPARVEGAVVGGAAGVMAYSTVAVWLVAAAGVASVVAMAVFFALRHRVREDARRPCAACGHRVAEHARVCPACGAACAPPLG